MMNPWNGILWLAGLQKDFEIVDAKKFTQSGLVELTLKRLKREARCSECGTLCQKIHSTDRAELRDLSAFGYKIRLILPKFTVRCHRCNKNVIEHHWLFRPKRTFTWRYECQISRMCEEMTNISVGRLEGMNDKTVFNIDFELLKLRVERQNLPEIGPHYSMDEVYFRYFPEGDPKKKESFVTNLVDFKNRKVICNAPGRGQAAAETCLLTGLTPKQREEAQSFATDLHEPFHVGIRKHCPTAEIVLDRFHIMKLFNEAMDNFRKTQQKITSDEDEKKLLRGKNKWILLSNPKNLSKNETSLLDELKSLNERVVEALLIREQFVSFFDSQSESIAKVRWNGLMNMVNQADIYEFNEFFRKLKAWEKELWDYFEHKTSSGLIEALNHKIKATKDAAYGYLNLHYYRLKILQRVGFLNSKFAPLPSRGSLYA